MSKITLTEQFTLRALTDRIVAENLVRVYRLRGTLGIVTNKTYICASLTGAIEAAFLARLAGVGRVITALTEKPEDVKEAVNILKDADLVMLAYGGEMGPEENYALTKAFLEAAAEANLPADLFFHVRIWVPAFVQNTMKEVPKVGEYLAGKQLGTFTFDLEKGFFLFHRVEVNPQGEVSLHLLTQVPITLEHLDLLKRSL